MKVETNEDYKPLPFRPVTITVTIESEEEFSDLYNRMRLNVRTLSVPDSFIWKMTGLTEEYETDPLWDMLDDIGKERGYF